MRRSRAFISIILILSAALLNAAEFKFGDCKYWIYRGYYSNDNDEKIEAFSKAIENWTESDGKELKANAYYFMGTAQLLKGDFDPAAESYKKALDLNPKHAEAYSNLGLAYFNMEYYDKALDNCQKALALDPQLIKPYTIIATIYTMRKQTQNAIDHYNKAIELNPKYVDAYLRRSNLFFETEHFDDALKDCDRVIELNPNHPLVYKQRALIHLAAYRKNHPWPPDIGRFVQIDLKPYANRPFDHLLAPPTGPIVLGDIPFTILGGTQSIFQTQDHQSKDLPMTEAFTVNAAKPAAIHLLLNSENMSERFAGQKIGEIELAFSSGAPLIIQLTADESVRAVSSYDSQVSTESAKNLDHSAIWKNVWSEWQLKDARRARAFIDLVSISVPDAYKSSSLKSIVIRDLSGDSVHSPDPSLKLFGITIEKIP